MVTQAGLASSLSMHLKYLSNVEKTIESAVLNDIEGVAKKSKMKSRKERLNRAKKGLKTLNDKNGKDHYAKEEDTLNTIDDKMTFEEKLELRAAQIYSLCTHSEQRNGADYLKRVVMGMFLTECLRKAGMFEKCERDNLNKGISVNSFLFCNIPPNTWCNVLKQTRLYKRC